ncbi:MAG: hypothetical protein PHX07_07225 [Candidatus Marinimicrobia bacterium]|jgi:hypothetical protein|nr:hypothetical protein [Candidatus Neomarinimicrobiota bacterium]MDD4962013.1 hypothetical protein [Candidatus Neomarinimicrobiota bacterium]MDD5709137.1 hypothetical protein [Candidatus Neomarinimicrobiota bacterium]MDX9777571.1 hypothetical protein [bacterium]
MKKSAFPSLILLLLLSAGCATKSWVQLENQRIFEQSARADSTLLVRMQEERELRMTEQDSILNALQTEHQSLFLDMMNELYQKSYEISALEERIETQAIYIDSLIADVDTLQRLQTRFKDADYSIFDLSRVKTSLDSLIINQKHLSRELQYMIRDLNLIERNLMDIMNYSLNNYRNQMQAGDSKVKQDIYRNNATAYKMIMVYLMTNTSSDPNKLLDYIDSVYQMGDALDTVQVRFAYPGKTEVSADTTNTAE